VPFLSLVYIHNFHYLLMRLFQSDQSCSNVEFLHVSWFGDKIITLGHLNLIFIFEDLGS
jgi:hypothetical protein